MSLMSPYYKLNLLLLLFVLFASLAFVVHFFVPVVLQNFVLLQNLALSSHSVSYGSWKESDTPIYSRFYLFNITNPDQVFTGGKPILEEIGPYTFRHTFEKVNISWNDLNGTVEYRQVKRWIFEPSLTLRSLDDEIMHMNVPLMSAVYQIGSAPLEEQYIAYESLNSLIEAFKIKPILRSKVRHLLFDGYHDALLATASKFYPTQVAQTRFGWFYARNNTSTDGLYRIFTGQHDLGKKLGLMDTWNGDKSLSRWQSGERCRSLEHSSAGDLQPPFFVRGNYPLLRYPGVERQREEMPTVRMFLGDMCRVFELVPQRPVTVGGLPAYRYRSDPAQFNYSVEQNQCYCRSLVQPLVTHSADHHSSCPPNGLYHLGICAKGSPLFVSKPHFLHSDSSLLERVRGLAPSEDEHEFYFDYDQNLALPLHVNARLQINLLVKKVDQVEIMENWTSEFELYLPQFWSATSTRLDDSMLAQLHFLAVSLPLILFSATVLFAVVACFLLSFTLFYAFSNQMIFFGTNQIVKYESVSKFAPEERSKDAMEGTSDYRMREL